MISVATGVVRAAAATISLLPAGLHAPESLTGAWNWPGFSCADARLHIVPSRLWVTTGNDATLLVDDGQFIDAWIRLHSESSYGLTRVEFADGSEWWFTHDRVADSLTWVFERPASLDSRQPTRLDDLPMHRCD
ncbi:MAG: hypothetical protein AAFX44_19425 [Pseudomonadota bacterium]